MRQVTDQGVHQIRACRVECPVRRYQGVENAVVFDQRGRGGSVRLRRLRDRLIPNADLELQQSRIDGINRL